jgi:hypothetical protein
VYTHTTTTTEEESLTIRMKRGVVARVDYTNSANPAENRSAWHRRSAP